MRWGKISIKGKIFSCLAVFSVCILIVLWLLQTVFLDEFYQMIKESEVRGYSQTIADNIDSEDLTELLNRVTESGDICVHLIGADGEQLQESGKFRYCSLQEMDAQAKAVLFQKVQEKGGTKMMYFNEGGKESLPAPSSEPGAEEKKHPWLSKPLFSVEQIQQSLSYFQIADRQDGTQVMISINARITPLSATVRTLRVQILCIGVLFFVLAGLLAVWMSRFIAKPIEDINRSSKELARGNYEVSFNGHGYREITELSDTLNVTAQALGRVDRLRKDLVANVSHDLRTPLTMIIGYGEVMRDIPGENTPENIQIIVDEAQRLSLLVNDLLDLSQVEAGVRRMEKSRFNLTEEIRKTLSRYQKLVEQQGYTVEFEAEEDAWIQADQVKIGQVIYNLINNAIKYGAEGKRVLVKVQATDTVVTVSVTNYGYVIPKEELPLLFEKFYRVEQSRSTNTGGTGLGLAIAKNIVDMHGGTIGVTSDLNGTVFTVKLKVDFDINKENFGGLGE